MKLQKTFAESPKSWSVDAKTIDPSTFDLSVQNPNGGGEITHRSLEKIMDEIAALDAESWPELVGTLAGDDTILVISSGVKSCRQLGKRIREQMA